ncbi:MAG: SdpI family protein [Nitrolancea sp.]
MQVKWRVEIPQWLIIAAMFVAAATLWPTIPSRVPVHWDASGNANGYGGKFEALLLMPIITIGLYLLLLFIPRIDPGKANYAQFSSAYLVARYSMLVVMGAIYVFTILAVKGAGFNMTRVIVGVIAVMFIVLGNVLGKVRPNWFVGVRTPWTLSSKRSWVRTHRLAGWLFALSGILFLALAIVDIGEALIWVMLSVLGVMVATLAVYSYVEWRNDPEKTPPSGTLPG